MLRRNLRRNLSQVFSRRYASRNATALQKYPVSSKHHGFEIIKTTTIPEFSLTAVLLKHEASGAQHLHLDSANDNNNVFSIAFKTNPPDATGVPHILEHTTLCGSKKYPVRDPFFKMTNRSLSNFMNAMTGHDYTFYPFATTNPKDFENLMDVYLSSVLEPLLNYNDFIQEGWRLENSVLENIKSNLEFKGVVYNEMKGQYSNSMYYFYIKFLESVYPTLNNSGGDPTKMIKLTYKELVDFHSRNYHPSNAKTFTYGDLPLEGHLRRLDEYFRGFDRRTVSSDVKEPVFVTDPKQVYEVTVPGPFDSMVNKDISEQYNASITWYLGDPLDPSMYYNLFKWKVLASLLFDGHNSPLYQELIESGFSEDFSANTGLDSTSALFSITIGLNYLNKEKVKDLESVIIKVIKDNVIPKLKENDASYNDRVEALLHQIELGFKRHKPEFGFSLLSSLVPSWVNGADPLKVLTVEEILTKFKKEYSERELAMFEEILNDTLLNDATKKFKFTMEPKQGFSKELGQIETDNLESKIRDLTENDRKQIYERNIDLAKSQMEEQNADVLPSLTVEDISKKGTFYDIAITRANNKDISERIVDTNGLVYVNALKEMPFLSTKYYKYLPLFNSCLTNLAGTTETSITDLETKIQLVTGGISFSHKISPDPYNINSMKLHYSLGGVALKENAANIYQLWREILQDTRFSDDDDVLDKLNTLIKNMGQNQINAVADSGHSYACGVSNSKITPAKYIREVTGGLDQVQFVMEMNRNLESKGKDYLRDEVLPILRSVKEAILQGDFKYRVVGDLETVKENETLIGKFDEQISSSTTIPPTTDGLDSLLESFKYNHASEKQLVNLPFQVGYSCLAKKGTSFSSKEGAALQILSQLYTFKNLHSKIREANGAYGGGLTYDGLGGTLDFYSYRDPNPIKSIRTFEESFAYGLDAQWTEKDLTEAKLRVFQSIDAPINIASQGATQFFEGINDDLRQERRENFLSTTIQDLQHVTQNYLVNNPDNFATVIGDKELFKVDNSWNIKNLKL
ncbi:Cym1 protein [Candida orthopsilosis Co 90-125]|uniref:Presequence protease, mitochondrial n=1 Tax=Candida orthopsilosis (strain 90-125) TaxID=1136231 RepID=H8X3X4_CANO9|nr:Cym1 protein [Candida orthopsilosis Co 90-125]CCG25762.1 Cym1 protein [Candida orthopsilosis Co 90-125]